jgi:hypothetical protein
MKTTFSLLCDRCGLSHREAANFLDVRLDTVKSWSSGRNPAPLGVLSELRDLYVTIEAAALANAKQIEALLDGDGAPDKIEIGLAGDDHEAQLLGWPCVGAHAAVLGLVAAKSPVPVAVVPSGATVATVAATNMRV